MTFPIMHTDFFLYEKAAGFEFLRKGGERYSNSTFVRGLAFIIRIFVIYLKWISWTAK